MDYDVLWIAIVTSRERYRAEDGTVATVTCSGDTPQEALDRALAELTAPRSAATARSSSTTLEDLGL